MPPNDVKTISIEQFSKKKRINFTLNNFQEALVYMITYVNSIELLPSYPFTIQYVWIGEVFLLKVSRASLGHVLLPE